jgi:hypothetical protein
VAVVTVTLVAWLFLDSYFMHRAEGAELRSDFTAKLAQLNTAQQAQLSVTSLNIEYAADLAAKRTLESKLFELEQIPVDKLSPQNRAVYQRAKRERDELVELWNRRGRPLR